MPTLVFAGEGFFQPNDAAIHSFLLHEGTLVPSRVTKHSGTFPMWLSVDPRKRFLYVVESTGGEETDAGFVHAYALGPNGALTVLGTKQNSGGSVPCHCTVAGSTLLVANYVGGTISALPILADGSLAPAGCVIDHGVGTGTHASGRQAKAHPHMITTSLDGRFVFVADLGTNSIIGYTLACESEAVPALTKHTEHALQESAGPRHMAFSPTAPFAYVLNELDNTVVPLAYNAEDGTFGAITDLPDGGKIVALPEGTPSREFGGASEIIISADGKFAYCQMRFTGKDNLLDAVSSWAVFNQIATLSLDAESGAVKLIETVDSGGNMPWTMTFAGAKDELLIAQNQHTSPSKREGDDGGEGSGPGNVVVFKRDEASGKLTPTGVSADVPSCVGICVVELP